MRDHELTERLRTATCNCERNRGANTANEYTASAGGNSMFYRNVGAYTE
jgi:hypothetical protein